MKGKGMKMLIRKKKLIAQIESLKQDCAVLRMLVKAYMRRNKELEEEIAALNLSLDAMEAEKEHWRKIAHKADERRRNYVRANCKRAD